VTLVLIGAGAGLVAGALLGLLPALLRRRPVSDEALAERERRLAGRERGLAARERDLQAKIDELRAIEPAPAPDLGPQERELAEREAALAQRVEAVTKRELAVARAAATKPAPAPPPGPEPVSQAPAPVAAGGPYNLATLEQAVAARAAEFPERRDEWESYLFFLRDYADADGRLPASFDALVADTFEPLLS
jgi:hypothetical protein